MRAFIYIRVSTDQQAKDGDSLDEQETTLKKYANDQGYAIVDIYRDEGVSGRKESREGLDRLMSDVKAGMGDIILFTFLSRFGRDLRHYLNMQEVLEKCKVVWRAVHEPVYNTDTPAGRAMIAQMMTFMQLESEMTGERIKVVVEHKIAKGEVVSGRQPFGLKIVDKEGGGKKLVHDENNAIVQTLFKEFDKLRNIQQSINTVQREHNIIITKKRAASMLRNKKYIGEHRGNLNYCPPTVTHELFYRVQKKLPRAIKSNTNRVYLFSGLLRCGECGKSFGGSACHIKSKRADGTEAKYIYKTYKCLLRNNCHKSLCDNKNVVSEHTLEKYLLENVERLFNEHELAKSYNAQAVSKGDSAKKKIKLETDLKKLNDLYMIDMISFDEVKKRQAEINAEIKSLTVTPTLKRMSEIKTMLANEFATVYNNADELQKRQMWQAMIDTIIIDKDRNYRVIFLT